MAVSKVSENFERGDLTYIKQDDISVLDAASTAQAWIAGRRLDRKRADPDQENDFFG
jgi:hypothetical protein